MEDNMDIQSSEPAMRRETRSWNAKALRCCAFGIRVSGEKESLSSPKFGAHCRKERLIRCPTIANRWRPKCRLSARLNPKVPFPLTLTLSLRERERQAPTSEYPDGN